MLDNLQPPSLLPLDPLGTANAPPHALELRRTGLARDAMTNALNGVVVELPADAMISAGYVVSVQRSEALPPRPPTVPFHHPRRRWRCLSRWS